MSPASTDLALSWLWRGSLVLAGLALAIATGLACRRWFEERLRGRRRVRKEAIGRLVQALLASPVAPTAGTVPSLEPGDEPALFSVALDILRVTRGRDAERVLQLLEIWNLRPWLERALSHGRRNRQIRVLTLLSYFQDEASLRLLLDHVWSPAIYVQLAALRGVAERGDVAHLPEVVRALTDSRETNVPMLADILRRFGEPAVPFLVELARNATVPPVRMAAVTALGHIGSLRAFDGLVGLVADPEPALRVRALESLARLGDPRAGGAVGERLADPVPRVRAAAAHAAGLLGLRELLPQLASALEDDDWSVRHRAAEALYALGAPGQALLRAAAAAAPAPGDDGEEIPERLAAAMAAELLAEKDGVGA